MSSDDPVAPALKATQVVGELIQAAGDTAEAKAAAREIGKTAVTITKAINNVLLPLAMINFAFDKAREYFEKQFALQFEPLVRQIPADSIVEPKASIAGPALQGLAFSHEEPALRDMYLNLLASAMDGRIAEGAHPAFAEIIKQLSGEDARLLKIPLSTSNTLPIAEVRLRLNNWRIVLGQYAYSVLIRHLQDIVHRSTGESSVVPRMSAMVDNWIRLGLVSVDYTSFARRHTGEDLYAYVHKRPEYKNCIETYGKTRIAIVKGVLQRTSFGEDFAQAVGLAKPELSNGSKGDNAAQ
jgi:hypothetical protein